MWPFKKKEKKLTEFEEKILEKCRGVKTWRFSIAYVGKHRLATKITYYSSELKFTISMSHNSVSVNRGGTVISLSRDVFGVKLLELIDKWGKEQRLIKESFILS